MDIIDSTTESESSRVSEHWSEQFIKNRTDLSCWVNNKIIASQIQQRISGSETDEYWLTWLLTRYFHPERVFERSLSICCGDGGHEIQLSQSGKVKFVQGIDLSEGALQQARARFVQAGVPETSYRFEVGDCNELHVESGFDLILASAALHHVKNLEGLLTKLKLALLPEGYLVLLEYVGPNRFQWTDRQCELINGMLSQLDPHFLAGNARTRLTAPPVSEMIRIDPSEAIRSRDILPLIREHFEVEYESNFNGTIAHMLFPLLNSELSNQGNRDFDSIVRMILYFEEQLIRFGALESDFVFMICRAKNAPSSTLGPVDPPGWSAPVTMAAEAALPTIPWLECADLLEDRERVHVQGWVASNRPIYAAHLPGTPPVPLVIFERPDVRRIHPHHAYVRGFDGIAPCGLINGSEITVEFDLDEKIVRHSFRISGSIIATLDPVDEAARCKRLKERLSDGLIELEKAGSALNPRASSHEQQRFNRAFETLLEALADDIPSLENTWRDAAASLRFSKAAKSARDFIKTCNGPRRGGQHRWNQTTAEALTRLHLALQSLGHGALDTAGVSIQSSLKIEKRLKEVRRDNVSGWKSWFGGLFIDQHAVNTRLRLALKELHKMAVHLRKHKPNQN